MDKRKPIPKLPAPTREGFYAWMLERLDLPEGTPLTRGFFEASRVLNFFVPGDLRALWWTRGRMNADEVNTEWRVQLSAKSGINNDDSRDLWRRFPISVQGLEMLGHKLKWPNHSEILRGNFGLYDGMTPAQALVQAEQLLRRDIEIRGRAYVAEKGVNFYIKPLEYVPSISAHETLEVALRWRDLGLFAPHDADLQTRFSDVLREHALWLDNHKTGKRAQLCGRDLREVSWHKGALRGADLRGAILRNLNLEGDDLRGADLRYADLTAARLAKCRLSAAKLEGTLLDFAWLPTTDLFWLFWLSHNSLEQGAVVDNGRGVRHHPVHWRQLRGDLSGCDLRGRIFRHIKNAPNFDFTDCNLRQADLSNFSFSGASQGVSFRGADLRGANVWGANFNRCDLTGANLEGIEGADWAQWSNSAPRARDFRGVQWRSASLSHRNFTDCDLEGADLRHSHLNFADFSGANLRGANLRNCIMVQANFINANLSDCDLRGVNLEHVKLQGACLDGARTDKDALNPR